MQKPKRQNSFNMLDGMNDQDENEEEEKNN